ncbi:MAG: imidazole glycerol phosphate synthase subunit HisH [Sulfurospirillum sp.]|nr:imidazole glycerol phosphate synthase subunit HisH [Sulfurospirillum sp.]MBL0703678.1 imidazole glycerol phosphate synthase subunit HisH [Sulfurospirillum sp.]
MIALIDYNMGNLRSVSNAFDKIGSHVEIVKDPNKLKDFDKIVLPGVGAYKDAMRSLKSNGMQEAIIEFAKSGKHLLGICLGMQLLLESSEEFGFTQGLGLVEGNVKKFNKLQFNYKLKVPHMGWNKLFVQTNSKLFKDIDREIYLYFIHSFHAICPEKFIVGKTFYGYDFASAIEKENIYGFQPHPEKSHVNGLKILKNFVKL